jgi:hypothetical protein
MSPPQAKALIPPAAPPGRLRWWLALAGLLAWQAWLTLGLFGPEQAWDRLTGDEPVVSGRHALHLYHGTLGARTLLEHGSLSCYDPAFHAGYPKTPVFDSGSRPAELTLALAGGRYNPRAYKVGLALLSLLVPLLVFTSARVAGLRPGPAVLAAALGLLVWWGAPCREALDGGAVDLLLGTFVALLEAGLLLRYHRASGPFGLLGLSAAVAVGWFAHPVLMVLMLPLFFVYYLSVGARHRLAWHGALWGGLLLAVGVNGFWLVEWVGNWWIRVPPMEGLGGGLNGLWEAPLWGTPVDRALACGLIGAAAVGVVRLHLTRQRPAARLLGLGWAGFLGLAVLGPSWEGRARLGADHLLVPAMMFAILPAAYASGEALGWAWRGRRRMAAVGAACAALAGAILARGPLAEWLPRLAQPEPLQVGLGQEREAVVAALRQGTTADARILWEDRRLPAGAPQWTALLPVLTGRAFIGGLDAEAAIEHTCGGLLEGNLAGRPLPEWTDAELQDYCDRYNIGWVVCWSPRSRERFTAWEGAAAGVPLPAEGSTQGPGLLVPLRRKPSFALRGAAVLVAADAQHIVLSDVRPQPSAAADGRGLVELSLHYQAGMRVTPSRVRLERAEESQDAIPFLRLVVDHPATRVTITWEKR